jgi:hypothetical protein
MQAVLNSIQENYFHGVSVVWEKDGIAVYVPKETILKEMTATIKLSQLFFFDLGLGLSNR